MKDLSVIIVSYNSKDVLGPCLRSINRSQTKYSFEVLLHDNGSPDGSANFVSQEFPAEKYPWLKIIHGQNLGFAAGNNVAIKQSQGRYVLLLNPDTEVEPDTFEVMLEFMERHPEVGMATCKVVLPSGGIDKASRRAFPTPWVAFSRLSGLSSLFPKSKLFNKYNLGYLSEDDEYEIDSCVGAFQLTRREVIDKIGLLDESYFMYGEDIEWCYRARQAGWRVYYYPRTKIFHHKGHTAKFSPRALWEFHRAMIIFYRSHFAPKYPWIVNQIIYFAIWARYLIKARFKPYKPVSELRQSIVI